jgi:hypothetical protein
VVLYSVPLLHGGKERGKICSRNMEIFFFVDFEIFLQNKDIKALYCQELSQLEITVFKILNRVFVTYLPLQVS